MKEIYSQTRKFVKDFWWEMGRWTLLFCLISMGIATLILWWRFDFYPFLVYLCCFFGSLAAAWVLMFRRRPIRKEFHGDA